MGADRKPGNHSSANTTVSWLPTVDDVDVHVPQAGNHQLTWEAAKDNPGQDPDGIKGRGFTVGFHIQNDAGAAVSSSSTIISSSGAASSSTIDTSAIETGTATSKTASAIPTSTTTTTLTLSTSSGISQSAIIGFSVGCCILATIVTMGLIWWLCFYHKQKRRADEKIGYLTSTSPVYESQQRVVDGAGLGGSYAPVEADDGKRITRRYEIGDGRREVGGPVAELGG